VLAQVAAKQESSAWAMPLFGVVGMFAFAAGFGMDTRRRGQRTTRQVQISEATDVEEGPLLA